MSKIGDIWYEKHTVVKMSPRDEHVIAESKSEKINAIEIPEDATNGDMIKAMFPNVSWFVNEDDEVYTDHITVNPRFLRISLEFWNSPFKRGE